MEYEYVNESALRLFHLQDDEWVDITEFLDTESNLIYGLTDSLSPFAVFERENQSPVADAEGPYLGAVNTAIAFDGTGSSDPDGDPLTYTWDFGDTSTGSGVNPTHSYLSAGIYDVCLSVNDGTADSDPACTIAVVYDSSAGFVTGGGWIDSPAREDYQYMEVGGRANFGFVAKYKKGASVPEGQTEFVFTAGNLNFHSSSYEWLVVNQNDSNAQFKGSGTINGEGD